MVVPGSDIDVGGKGDDGGEDDKDDEDGDDGDDGGIEGPGGGSGGGVVEDDLSDPVVPVPPMGGMEYVCGGVGTLVPIALLADEGEAGLLTVWTAASRKLGESSHGLPAPDTARPPLDLLCEACSIPPPARLELISEVGLLMPMLPGPLMLLPRGDGEPLPDGGIAPPEGGIAPPEGGIAPRLEAPIPLLPPVDIPPLPPAGIPPLGLEPRL